MCIVLVYSVVSTISEEKSRQNWRGIPTRQGSMGVLIALAWAQPWNILSVNLHPCLLNKESWTIVGSIEVWSSNLHAKKIVENSRRGQKAWWASPSQSNWFKEFCKWLYLSDSNSFIQDRMDDYNVWPRVEPSFFSDLDIVWFKNHSGRRAISHELGSIKVWSSNLHARKIAWEYLMWQEGWMSLSLSFQLLHDDYTFLITIHWFKTGCMITMY